MPPQKDDIDGKEVCLTVNNVVEDLQTNRDAGNRSVRGGVHGGRGGRGPGGVPRRRSPQPPSGEETVSEVNSFDDFPIPHFEANPFAAYGGRRREEATFAGGYRARHDWGLDREYGQWEDPFRVDIPEFDSEQVDGPLYDGTLILDEEPSVTEKNLCGYMGVDENIKYWDTETGQVISTFSTGKIPYVVRLNPDEYKQNVLLAGTSGKKIVPWNIKTVWEFGILCLGLSNVMSGRHSTFVFDRGKQRGFPTMGSTPHAGHGSASASRAKPSEPVENGVD
ncbi:collinsiaXVI-like protein [Striga asiatica]|uniref:CollinsiaXVI-like protein n=1 Tax=Striga asiatica TaxID=4170 RepID=A0A5A7PMA2_STRAF|nr:collinsiaXVI-like protein [Striga asiatica]